MRVFFIGDGIVEVDFGLAARLDDDGPGRIGENTVTVPISVSLLEW